MPKFDELFNEFGVKDESGLTELLQGDNICELQCVCCLKKFDIEKIIFVDGDPYCFNCAGYENETSLAEFLQRDDIEESFEEE